MRIFNTLSMLLILVFSIIKHHHYSVFSMTPTLCFPSHVLLFTENPESRGGELLVDLPD